MLLNPARMKYDYRDYWYNQALGVIGASGVSTSAHTNNPPEQEISTLGLVGIEMKTAGDMINMGITLPKLMDWTKPLGVRVLFQTASATAADTITWKALYSTIAWGVDALAVGTTALDTIIAQMTVVGTAQVIERTPRGVIDGNKFTMDNIIDGDLISFNIEMEAKAGGLAEDIIFLGLRLEFFPKYHLGAPIGSAPGIDFADELYRGDADASGR